MSATTEDLRTLGVLGCDRCHGTGLTAPTPSSMGFCDCPTGRALWDAALHRATEEVAAELPQTVFVAYDKTLQEIPRVFESRRDAQAWCDEQNSYLAYDRYEVETDERGNWDETQIQDAS